MSILDTLGAAIGAATQPHPNSPGGASGAVIAQLLALLESRPGGLAGLLESFRGAGLGQIVESWIGTGANLPISPEQVKSALGSDSTARMAQAIGLSQSEIEQHLAAVLPQLIDRLTPGGQVPNGDLRTTLSEVGQWLLHR